MRCGRSWWVQSLCRLDGNEAAKVSYRSIGATDAAYLFGAGARLGRADGVDGGAPSFLPPAPKVHVLSSGRIDTAPLVLPSPAAVKAARSSARRHALSGVSRANRPALLHPLLRVGVSVGYFAATRAISFLFRASVSNLPERGAESHAERSQLVKAGSNRRARVLMSRCRALRTE